MKYPVLINVVHPILNAQGQPTKQSTISRAVIDMHPDAIERIVPQPDGLVSIKVSDGWIKLGVTFDDIFPLLQELIHVDMRFKELVDSYTKDNYNAVINRNNGREGTNQD